MTRYKHTEFADDDTSSIGSVQLNGGKSSGLNGIGSGGVCSGTTHIRYHTGRGGGLAGALLWRRRSPLEKALLMLVATLLFVVFVLVILLSFNSGREKVLFPIFKHCFCH